jgi:hypothetical protein
VIATRSAMSFEPGNTNWWREYEYVMALPLSLIAGTQRAVTRLAPALALLAGLAGSLAASDSVRRGAVAASARRASPASGEPSADANGAIRNGHTDESRTEPLRSARWSLGVRAGEQPRDGSTGSVAAWVERAAIRARYERAEPGSALDRAWGVRSPGLPAPSSRAPPMG